MAVMPVVTITMMKAAMANMMTWATTTMMLMMMMIMELLLMMVVVVTVMMNMVMKGIMDRLETVMDSLESLLSLSWAVRKLPEFPRLFEGVSSGSPILNR
eukprot:863582-Pyramimonas_sp.AAC.1